MTEDEAIERLLNEREGVPEEVDEEGRVDRGEQPAAPDEVEEG